MSRPPLEVADLIRAAGTTFYQRSRKWFTWLHLKILTAIVCCRTSTLGGHIDECSRCGHRAISFNSCRNRHCPKCQSNARDRWLEARRRELLPVRYAHVVFTLPGQLAPLALQNKSEIYGLLFRASAETLLTVARDERHLGAEIGFFSVLHTWNQKLLHHPHVHCVVPAGGLSPDHTRWIAARPGFFLPVRVLSRVFRGKFVAGLRELHAAGKLGFHGDLAGLAAPAAFAPCCEDCSVPIGWSMPNVRSAGPSTRSAIWAVTRTGWPSRITVWWRWRMGRSCSAGATRRIRIRSG